MKTLAVEKAKSRPLSTLTINSSVEPYNVRYSEVCSLAMRKMGSRRRRGVSAGACKSLGVIWIRAVGVLRWGEHDHRERAQSS